MTKLLIPKEFQELMSKALTKEADKGNLNAEQREELAKVASIWLGIPISAGEPK